MPASVIQAGFQVKVSVQLQLQDHDQPQYLDSACHKFNCTVLTWHTSDAKQSFITVFAYRSIWPV